MSLTRNFLFSSVLTVSNYLFPFIVYPYVARVLGVDNVGIVNFVDSIVNYAMLLSLMGITIIGTRNVAKAKGDPERLNVVFSSLFVLTAVFTILATIVLVSVTYTVEALHPYKKMLLIGLIKLWGNFLLIDWFYKGLENFKYITLRTILVKCGYLIAVFVFIHKASDYTTYFLLLCLMVAVNAFFNCVYAMRLVKFKFDIHYTFEVVGSFLILGIYIMLNSMYTTFNVTYLGFRCGDTEVGYYTTATKIFNIILSLYTAYSAVVLPRASSLLTEGKKDEFLSLIKKSVQGLLLFSIPASVFFIIFSPGVVSLIAGQGYEGAIMPMMIVMPLIFIIGYEQILVIQILTPHSTDSLILFNSFIGATCGIVGNILLVGHLQAVGSAITWLTAEIAVLITAQLFVSKIINLHFPFKDLLYNIAVYVPYIVIALIFVNVSALNPKVEMFIGAAAMIVYFCVVQTWILKNPVYQYTKELLAEKLLNKILRKNKA